MYIVSNLSLQPIGFIGLGNMGGYMAHNLLKAGYPLVVYDLNPAALAKVQAQAKELKLTGEMDDDVRERERMIRMKT